jgi:hypothetical protein
MTFDNFPLYLVYDFCLDNQDKNQEKIQAEIKEEDEFKNVQSGFYKIIYSFTDSDEFINLKSQNEPISGFSKITLFEKEGGFGEGIFSTLSDLHQYSSELCLEMKAPHLYLMSVDEMNSLIKSAETKTHFRNLIPSHAKMIKNPLIKEEKNSFFKRIFKDS